MFFFLVHAANTGHHHPRPRLSLAGPLPKCSAPFIGSLLPRKLSVWHAEGPSLPVIRALAKSRQSDPVNDLQEIAGEMLGKGFA